MASAQHSQPREEAVFNNAANPVEKKPSEEHSSHHTSGKIIEHRGPHDGNHDAERANPTPLARGIQGKESIGSTKVSDTDPNIDDQKPDAPPSEGRVYDAVTSDAKPGTGGQEPSFTSNLDAKKAEQQEARKAVKDSRSQAFDVGGREGQTGGPANPVQD